MTEQTLAEVEHTERTILQVRAIVQQHHANRSAISWSFADTEAWRRMATYAPHESAGPT